jgi:hypothetical protein
MASAVFDIAAEQNPAAAMPFWRYTHAGIARQPAGKTSGASGSFLRGVVVKQRQASFFGVSARPCDLHAKSIRT